VQAGLAARNGAELLAGAAGGEKRPPYRLPDATMVVSQTLQQYYRQRYNRDTVYVPNGATLAPARMPRRSDEWNLRPDNYVLFLGRFSPRRTATC